MGTYPITTVDNPANAAAEAMLQNDTTAECDIQSDADHESADRGFCDETESPKPWLSAINIGYAQDCPWYGQKECTFVL